MGDLEKIRETRSKEGGGDWDEWPYPTVTIESVISGDLKKRIMARLGLHEISVPLILVEETVSGGYSEYTQEDESSIEVQRLGETLWRTDYHSSGESAMAQFLTEFAGE